MSGLLLLCTELTLFCIELPENCIFLKKSERSNFFMYIIRDKTVQPSLANRKDVELFDFIILFYFIISLNLLLYL